jgi:hypothetical protein
VQPQGGQANANSIRGNDFENNSGGAIQLNGALDTYIEENWFEGNNVSVGAALIQCVVSGGANNNPVFNENVVASTGLATTVFDHSSGAVLEFNNNIGLSITGTLANFSNGTIYQASGNGNFGTTLTEVYPAASIKVPISGLMVAYSNFLNASAQVSVAAGPTTIIPGALGLTGAGSLNTPYLSLIHGFLSGNGSVQFSDLVLWFTNGPAPLVIGSSVRNAPAARTYTMSALNLQLQMAANTYFVHALQLSAGVG